MVWVLGTIGQYILVTLKAIKKELEWPRKNIKGYHKKGSKVHFLTDGSLRVVKG